MTNSFLNPKKSSQSKKFFFYKLYGFFGNLFKPSFQTLLKISGLFVNLPNYLETAQSKKNDGFFVREDKVYQSKGFLDKKKKKKTKIFWGFFLIFLDHF